ncbi:MAG: hypothetical protein LC687_03180 [Actinobacteria bacterium]|nr:hypothetical protein [Actinomycetota bacterium]
MEYENFNDCVLDIMANTDARYRVARLAARYVYDDGWSYNNHPNVERGVCISPDFDGSIGNTIFLC